MDEVERPLNTEDQTMKDNLLSRLLEIFPDKKPAYLKVNILFSSSNITYIDIVENS